MGNTHTEQGKRSMRLYFLLDSLLMRMEEPPRWAPTGAFPSRQTVVVDGRVPFISWQFSEMNQTTRPPRDPHGEQGNKCLALKTRTFPRALVHRDNVMAEFPLWLFQTGKETRSFQDLTWLQILLVLPSFCFPGTGKMEWAVLYKTFGRVLSLWCQSFEGGVKSL